MKVSSPVATGPTSPCFYKESSPIQSILEPIENQICSILKAFKVFKIEQERLTQGETLNPHSTEQAAQHLAKVVNEFRNTLLKDDRFSASLLDKEIPFPLAYRLTQLLVEPEIQCYEKLKEEISKTTRIFVELVVFQCALKGKRIYKTTTEGMRTSLQTVIDTLPKQEVLSRFELRCTHAAIKKLDVGIGKWKEIGKDAVEDFGTALLQVLFSTSLSGASGIPLASPIVNVSKAIYKALEEQWYKKIWLLKWNSAEAKVTTQDQFNKIKPLFEASKDSPEVAIYMSQLFKEIINNSQAEEPLRKNLLEGEDLSLLAFLKLKEKKFWEARFCTLIQLESLAITDHKLIGYIVEKYYDDKEKRIVREKAGAVLANLFALLHQIDPPVKREIQSNAKNVKENVQKKLEAQEKAGTTLEIANEKLKKRENEKEGLEKELSQLGGVKPGPVEQNVGDTEKIKQKTDRLMELKEEIDQCKDVKRVLNGWKMQQEAAWRIEKALETQDWESLRFPLLT